MMSDTPIEHFLDLAGEMLRSDAAREAPVVEGRLRGDITVFPRKRGEVSVGNTALIDYAKYVYYGTGLYGPKKKRITPKRARAMRMPLKGGGYAFFTSSKGIKPNPYLERALEQLISSGRLTKLLDGFSDEMSEEMFTEVSKNLKNIQVR